MKTKHLLKLMVFASLSFSSIASAAIAGTPQQPSCLQSNLSLASPSSPWYTAATITVKNNCSAAIDLKSAAISFQSNSNSIGSVWTWPFSSSGMNTTNGVASFTLTWQGDQYSPSTLAVNASKDLTFGINLNGQVFNLPAAQQSLQVIPGGTPPAPTNGVINVIVDPTGASSIKGSEAITLASGTFSQQVTNSTWNQKSTYPVTGLTYGTYTISAAAIGDYLPIVTPSSVVVGTNPQNVTITYKPTPAVGTVAITLPAAPLSGLSSSTAITLKDQTSNQTYTQTTSWNSTATFTNLPANDTVIASVPTMTNGQMLATPTPLPAFTVSKGITTTKTVSYQLTPQTTVSVPFTLSGLSSNNANVSLTDTYGNIYNFANLGNGVVNKLLPVSNSYNVTATAPNLAAKITPTAFNTTSGTNQTPVSISFGAMPTQQLAAYWAGWMGYQFDLNNTYGKLPITDLYLAFANYANGAIDTSASGYITVPPKALTQIWPSYQNWTTYAFNHPKAHMILSVGGATYSAMWANLNSTQAAQTMANTIVATLNTAYPVYAPTSASQPSSAFAVNGPAGSAGPQYGNSALLGTVNLSGVDLDVEVDNLPAITPYLLTLIEAIHQAAPTKMITLATFSVAADPIGACTVPGSAHCGEALPLIKAINTSKDQSLKDVVTYNVMAYDANSAFVLGANPGYQTALQNYTTAVGNAKHVILGLDLQTQWGTPSFSQTCAELQTESTWAYQHPSVNGGTFLWEIGDDSHCPALTVLTNAANAMNQ